MFNTLFGFALESNAKEDVKKDISKYSEKYNQHLELSEKPELKYRKKSNLNLKESGNEKAEDTSNYSEAYKRYLELSDEEKAKVEVIPRKYNVPLDSIYEDTIEVKDLNLGSGKDTKRVSIFAESLPSKFDLRDRINVQVEDQNIYGLCWDFASLTSLETNLALKNEQNYDFSELHVDYLTSDEFGGERSLHSGGNFEIFKDYICSESGPVNEDEVPYNAVYGENQYNYLLSLLPKAYVYETVDFPTINKIYNTYTDEELELFKDKVKKHIMDNGSLYCAILGPENGAPFYNSATNAEYFNGDMSQGNIDHAVSIIGWDDNYSRYNFNENQRPEKDGAYIILNSWGDWWGDNGIFYVSYEDYYITQEISGIISAGVETPEYEEIQFEDVNIYNAVKEFLDERIIKNFDDEKKSITISKFVLDSINELELRNIDIKSFKDLDNFYNLTKLVVDNCNFTEFPDTTPLKKLDALYLTNDKLENIDSVVKLNNLKELVLDYNYLHDLPDMSELSNLSLLSLTYNRIMNIEPILCLSNLNELWLDCASIRKLPDMSSLSNLKYLNLEANTIKNIEPLLGLKNLTELNLEQNGLEELSDMSSLINLKYLHLRDNKIENIEPMVNLPNLTIAFLSCNNITELPPDMSKLNNLRVLHLGRNQIENIEPLLVLTNLKELTVYDNKISELPDMSSLTKLDYIFIATNNISDLNSLSNNHNIKHLYASCNKIAFIPDSLVNTFDMELFGEKVTFNVDQDLFVNSQNGIKLNDIFSYDYADPYYYGMILHPENCEVDLDNKMLNITPTSLGNGQAVLKIENGRYSGSEFTINYNAVKQPTNIEKYLFDAVYYADNNIDVRNAFGYDETQLRNHYYNYGIAEGRIASPVFNVHYYLGMYPDLYSAFNNDFASAFNHFVNYGIYEGRRGSEEFDVKYYIENNEDVANAFNSDFVDCLIHYVCYGRNEGRVGSEDVAKARQVEYLTDVLFDSDLYYSMYIDLQQALGNDYQALKDHYINNGIREGRIASFVFDPRYYIEANPDIKAAFGDDYYRAFYHFVNYGIAEGRKASKLFDVNYYLDNNEDIKNAFNNDKISAFDHFIIYGITEGRMASEEFNVHVYKDQNNDLSAVYGNSWVDYYRHYILWGQNENRICK